MRFKAGLGPKHRPHLALPAFNETRARLSVVAATLGAILAAQACDGNDVKVGHSPSVKAPLGDPALPIQAGDVWNGYVEGAAFRSGSDRLSFTFATPTSGTVWFGAEPSGPEPPVDPAIPPHFFRNGSGSPPFGMDFERFGFAMKDVSLEGSRLRFSVSLNEPWAQWCSLQTPVLRGTWPASHGCANGGNTEGPDNVCSTVVYRPAPEPGPPIENGTVPADCRKAAFCNVWGFGCECDATKCGPGPDRDALVKFDVSINDNRVDGSFKGFDRWASAELDGRSLHFVKQ